ncbi:protein SRC2-like [Corylus avellana]|uniref:protein SRC2-like n=1 Tax=Corylus avellana TaxID=13451 RepID=UPI001E22B42C|nr:protein SRC2-like [Corylus avellana]XP_059447757.1 protein SRC2-like [Corylus avellana]
MDLSSIELKLKVISARDLKGFNFFQKLSVYAVVRLVNEEVKKKQKHEQQQLQRQKTPVDRVGDRNPEWNHEMQFDLKDLLLPDDRNHLFLRFDLLSEGIVFGNNTVGEVQVPVFKDLIDDESNGAMRFVSYQVRSRDGKPNGVLNFSYKVKNGKTNKEKEVVKSDTIKLGSFSKEKIDYPRVEVENRAGGEGHICYPSLDDVVSPRISIPSPKSYKYWTPPSPQPYLSPAGVSYHPYPSIQQIPGIYCYKPESMSYGYALAPSLCGYSGGGASSN